jgi:hypothetical protein
MDLSENGKCLFTMFTICGKFTRALPAHQIFSKMRIFQKFFNVLLQLKIQINHGKLFDTTQIGGLNQDGGFLKSYF